MISLGKDGIPFNDFESIEKAIPQDHNYYSELLDLLKQWYNTENRQFDVMTSGSTGDPQRISLSREDMICSARRSSRFFEFFPGKRALLCLPLSFVAGKIMLVRAIVSELTLDVIAPSSNPLAEIDHELDFVAMTPMQLDGILRENPGKLDLVKTVLLGGAAVPARLKKIIPGLKSEVFLGYGMTETITHIALTKLSDPSVDYYKAMEGIRFEIDERNCLIVLDNLIGQTIRTNDIVKLIDPFRMKWLGRIDHVINSGGIKIHPEIMEEKLEDHLNARVLIMSEPDDKLGERMVLIAEMENSQVNIEGLTSYISGVFTRFHIPKAIYTIPQFPSLNSGKTDRRKAFVMARENGELIYQY